MLIDCIDIIYFFKYFKCILCFEIKFFYYFISDFSTTVEEAVTTPKVIEETTTTPEPKEATTTTPEPKKEEIFLPQNTSIIQGIFSPRETSINEDANVKAAFNEFRKTQRKGKIIILIDTQSFKKLNFFSILILKFNIISIVHKRKNLYV